VEESLQDKVNTIVKKTWTEVADFSEKVVEEGWAWLKKKFGSSQPEDEEEKDDVQVRQSYVRAKTVIE
jgi:hypothetical protein